MVKFNWNYIFAVHRNTKNLYFWKHGFPKHGRFILNGHTVPKTINVYTRNSTMYIKT